MSFVDTHAHLTFPQYDKDRTDVLNRAWDAGLSEIILVGSGDGIKSNGEAIKLSHTDRRLYLTIGIHPHDASKADESWFSEVERLSHDDKVIAIGEIGLDYHYDFSPPDVQKNVFKKMLDLCNETGLPCVIHDREAHEDVWGILKEVYTSKRGGVFHCFSGDVEFAKRVIDSGFLISIPGIVTFKNASQLHAVVKATNINDILIETDCPYLAPVPHRGKRNEPSFVVEVAKMIAELKALDISTVGEITTENARRVFNLQGKNKNMQIAYKIRNSLYLNITNRCNLACSFCPKFTDFEVKGYQLRLNREPSVDEVMRAIGDPTGFDEVVFCGYGESTKRLNVVLEVAKRLKTLGVRRIRLNTDGLVCLAEGKDVLPKFAGLIDSVSVSLNAPDAKTYATHCLSKYKEDAYNAVCDFIKTAPRYIPEVVASVVALPGLDIEACKRKARELGVPLRVREYMDIG